MSTNSLNRFLHGTLWKWVSNELALIISNDEYNSHSPTVNCVSVTNISGDSINIDNVQCNQIHTVEKEALLEFMGAIPTPILTAIKVKIQKQLNMGDDKTLHAVQETATRLIGQLAKLDTEYVLPEPPQKDQPKEVAVPPPVIKPTKSTKPTKPKQTPKQDKPQSKQNKNIKADNSSHKVRTYTDEDEAFVLDRNPTTEEVMKRFGFKEKRKVYDLKLQLKKRRESRRKSK
jgi:hypothetical protein